MVSVSVFDCVLRPVRVVSAPFAVGVGADDLHEREHLVRERLSGSELLDSERLVSYVHGWRVGDVGGLDLHLAGGTGALVSVKSASDGPLGEALSAEGMRALRRDDGVECHQVVAEAAGEGPVVLLVADHLRQLQALHRHLPQNKRQK